MNRHTMLAALKELRGLILIAAIIFPFRSSIADWNDVPTGSMVPTILEGDRIVVNKLAYDLKIPFTTTRLASWDAPQRGDIVVLFSPVDGTRLVKRIVGVPGDRLAMRANRLWLNGAPVAYDIAGWMSDGVAVAAVERLDGRPHAIQWQPSLHGAARAFEPLAVPAEHYFVMGDNRDNSRDSRSFGLVAREQIVGRAFAVALSFAPAHAYAPRWERFFTALN